MIHFNIIWEYLAKSNYEFLFFIFYTLFIDIIDGKIARIFDILTPNKQDIDEAKEYKEFYEICDFEVAKKWI